MKLKYLVFTDKGAMDGVLDDDDLQEAVKRKEEFDVNYADFIGVEIEGFRDAGNSENRSTSLIEELYNACEIQQRLIDEMLPFVGKMALQDYSLLNDAPIAAKRAMKKFEVENAHET